MTGTLVFWLAIAVPVFWAVGAHNRLARLRAAILQAYAQVSQQTAAARVAFNLATSQHDVAIRATPARFLARIMGFQPVSAL